MPSAGKAWKVPVES